MIIDTLTRYLPQRQRKAPNGWTQFNCPVCHHKGHRADQKGRGGVLYTHMEYAYHCFNCKFSTAWKSGHYFNKKNVELFEYLGVPKEVIGKCKLFAMGSDYNDQIEIGKQTLYYALPDEQKKIMDLVDEGYDNYWFMKVLEYIGNRNVNYLYWSDLYWSPSKDHDINKRFIIPVTFNDKIIGYNARGIDSVKVKYHAQVNKDFLYNGDTLYSDRKYCIITEGVLDALSINGVGVMQNDITDKQMNLLNSSKQIKIVVPDKDKSGQRLVDIALENEWYVSYPQWNFKDTDDAVRQYGRIASMQHILDQTQKTKFKIKLNFNKYFKG